MPLTEQIAQDVGILRRSFRENKTISLEARRASLEAFQTMMNEGAPLMCSALWQDLHKNATETMVSEVILIQNEIQEHLDHLSEWTSPLKVSTSLLNLPGKSAILSDPLGVCCVIGAWNYPFLLTLMPVVGCLAAGNTCLIRAPSTEHCNESARLIALLVKQYMDNTIVRVVQGDLDATKAVLAQKFDKIFFTGGTYVGKLVAKAAAEHLCPVVLELGGKSPCIVEASADTAVAAKRVAWATFMNAGQTCVRPDYVLVDASIADHFIKVAKDSIAAMYGSGHRANQESPDYGRIVNAKAHQRLVGLIESSKQYIVHGGHFEETQNFIEPTIMDFGTDTMAFAAAPVMAEEIFGPIMPLLRYESLDEALEFIKGKPKPLTLYCFTTNRSVQQRVLRDTKSGGAAINDCMMQLTNSSLPFGGVGCSGMGNYHGKASFDTFCHKKSVLYKTHHLDIPLRYPPYTAFGRNFLELLLRSMSRRQVVLLQLCLVGLAVGLLKMLQFDDWLMVFKAQLVSWAKLSFLV